MDRRTLRWLYKELPELVSQNVVPPDVAERIRQHYGEPEAAGSTARLWATILFSILGAALIGGGIILLLAHNWRELSRPVRAVIAVLPLALSSALGAWLLWTQRASTAWREGVGTFQVISIGVAISLISQTYNLGGRFDEFMLTWSLLGLPVAYLLGATFPALLYLVGITVWTGSVVHFGMDELWFFPLLGLALPYFWGTGRVNRYHPRPVLLAWFLGLAGSIGSYVALEHVCERLDAWPVLCGGLFALLFLVGARWWGDASSAWQRPFQNIGAFGAFVLALVLSFSDVWSHPVWRHIWEQANGWRETVEGCILAAIMIAAIALWMRSWTRRAWSEVMLGSVSAMTLVGWVLAGSYMEAVAALVFNLYLFVLGIGTLVIGLRGRRLGVVNAGMFVLAGVILCRFFDADLGFVVRGVGFILIGIGFLVTNLVLLRRKGCSQ